MPWNGKPDMAKRGVKNAATPVARGFPILSVIFLQIAREAPM
jgi:hypothetical protein